MHIVFTKIHIENFLSIGTADINLNESGYTLVNGVNNNPDDLAKSNGSGKSTIFEAINYALTGETIRGSKDIINIYGNDGALIELDFIVDNDSYKIIRSKDHSKYKTNLKIFINGEDKSGKGIRDTSKILSEYLPDLNSALLGSVIILGQGLPQRFSNNTPSGRKEVLEKLSKSDFMLEDLKERVAARKSQLGLALRSSEDTLLEYQSKCNLLNKQIEENTIRLNSLSSTEHLDELISMLENSIADCDKDITLYTNELESLRLDYNTITENKLNLNQQISKINADKVIISNEKAEIYNKISNEKTIIDAKWSSIINDINSKLTSIKADLNSKNTELIKLKNVVDTCPTCGQKLPGKFKPDTTELEDKIKQLFSMIQPIESELNKAINDKNNELDYCKSSHNNELVDVDKKIAAKDFEIGNINSDINKLNLTLSDINYKINKSKSDIDLCTHKKSEYTISIDKAKNEKLSLESNKTAAENIIKSNTNEIEIIKNKINIEETNKLDISKHLDIINKMTTALTREFRGYLLSNIIDFINRKSKEYSMEIFETDKIDFSLDGNNIDILYDSKDYQNLSGGERAKCDIIIQFAIRDMLCKYLNFSSNILVVDEIFDALDSIGSERVINMISHKLNDVQSIFIISHHADELQIPCDHILTVNKGLDKISRVNYAI